MKPEMKRIGTAYRLLSMRYPWRSIAELWELQNPVLFADLVNERYLSTELTVEQSAEYSRRIFTMTAEAASNFPQLNRAFFSDAMEAWSKALDGQPEQLYNLVCTEFLHNEIERWTLLALLTNNNNKPHPVP